MEIANFSAGSALRADGYCVVNRERWNLTVDELEGLASFRQEWDELEPDPYMNYKLDKRVRRLRRHGEFVYDRLTSDLTRTPQRAYVQAADHNPLYGGKAREFSPVKAGVENNAYFAGLIRANVELAHPAVVRTVRIHAHLVRIVGYDDLPGEPSPEGVHSDGFEYVSVHLVNLANAAGGVTEVLTRTGGLVLRTCLKDRLDSLFVRDATLLHYTSPIKPVEPGVAVRDALLLSYST